MSTMTTAQIPKKITDWMSLFHLDARSMQGKEKEDTKALALEAGKLLHELEFLPNFKDLLDRFANLATTWDDCCSTLDQFKKTDNEQGDGRHKQRKNARAELRGVIDELTVLRDELTEKKEASPEIAAGELRRTMAQVASAQKTLAKQVEDDGSPNAESWLSTVQEYFDRVKEDAAIALQVDEEDDPEGAALGIKLAAAGFRGVAREQELLRVSLRKEKRSPGSLNHAAYAEMFGRTVGRIQVNLKAVGSDPRRDEVALKACTGDFETARELGQQAIRKNDDVKLLKADRKLAEIEFRTLGLMGSQAQMVRSAQNIDMARELADRLFEGYAGRLDRAEANIERLAAVDPTNAELNTLRNDLGAAREGNREARKAVYEHLAAVKENPKRVNEDVLTPTRESFNDVGGPVDELASDIHSAMEGLNDIRQVELKFLEIKPFYDDACLVPADAPVPDRAGLETKLSAAKSAATPAEAFYLLDLLRDRCIDVVKAHKKGAKKDDNGKSYWDEKKKAQSRLKCENEALNQALKTLDPAQKKLAREYIKEAELYIARDEIVGFIKAVELLDLAKSVREHPPTEVSAVFHRALLDADPVISAAIRGNLGLGATLKSIKSEAKTHGYTNADLKALAEFRKACAADVQKLYSEWDLALRAASELAKFSRRLSESKDKALAKEGKDLLGQYEGAVAVAGRGDYPRALTALQDFVRVAKTASEEKDQEAETILQDAANPVDEFGNPLEWTGPSGKVKDSDYGFNTNRDAMLYTAGQRVNEDGTLVVSEELDDMAKFFEVKLKAFHALCARGKDPVEIGKKVFDPVPENFWPAEAVRVVVMFRAAEEEFEEEELLKEAKGLLKNPEALGEVDELREAVEKAKQKQSGKLKLDELREAVEKARQEEGGKHKKGLSGKKEELAELGLEGVEQVASGLALGEMWYTTKEFGVKEIGKVDIYHEELTEQQIADGETAPLLVGKAVGTAGGGAEALIGLIKVGMDVKDLIQAYGAAKEEKEKERFQARKEDKKFSPVKAALLEYERNRAVAVFFNDATDTVLNAISVGGHVPGLNIAGDVKGLVLAAMEAGRYFGMLACTLMDKSGSESDPDSLTHLALARQAKEEGYAGGKKIFEGLNKILKLSGDVVQLAGIAAPAGFAINLTSKTLDLGGKAVFKLIDWGDASKQMACIKRAKAVPADYQSIAEVFSGTRKYARFCIAWGCTHNDGWARAWVMRRGLTDSDLDDPTTGTAIIREYINVTQESLLGETQEEDPQTFGQSLPAQFGKGIAKGVKDITGAISDKVNKRNREIETSFFKVKKSDPLTVATWTENFESAIKEGGLYDNSEVRKITPLFGKVESAAAGYDPTLAPSTSDEDDEKFEAANAAYAKALDGLAHALGNYHPVDNDKRPHQSMKIYLGDLLSAVGRASLAVAKARDDHADSVDLRNAGGNAETAKANKASRLLLAEEDQSKRVEDYKSRLAAKVHSLIWGKKFKTPYGSYTIDVDGRKKILEDAAKRLNGDGTRGDELATLLDDINTACDSAIEVIVLRLSGLAPDEDEKNGMLNFPDRLEAEFKVQAKLLEAKLSETLKAAFGEVVKDAVGLYTWNASKDVPTPLVGDDEAIAGSAINTWKSAASGAAGKDGGWVPSKRSDRIASLLTEFAKSHHRVHHDIRANLKRLQEQGTWKGDAATLRSAVAAFPKLTTFGTDHPGMIDYCDRFIERLDEIQKSTEAALRKVNTTTEWNPPATFFDNAQLTPSNYKVILNLCKNRGLDPKTAPDGAKSSLEGYVKAQKAWQLVLNSPDNYDAPAKEKARKALSDALIKVNITLAAGKPRNVKKHADPKGPHVGMTLYIESVKRQTDSGNGVLTKRLKDEFDNITT